jgi:hypothetical protein
MTGTNRHDDACLGDILRAATDGAQVSPTLSTDIHNAIARHRRSRRRRLALYGSAAAASVIVAGSFAIARSNDDHRIIQSAPPPTNLAVPESESSITPSTADGQSWVTTATWGAGAPPSPTTSRSATPLVVAPVPADDSTLPSIGSLVPRDRPPWLGSDGSVNRNLMGVFTPVGNDGLVVGYVLTNDLYAPPTEGQGFGPPITIVDGQGHPIGQIIDGVPHVGQ